MDPFKRSRFKFRSLPRCVASAIRSISFESLDTRSSLCNTPSSPRRRNGISAESYNEIRKLILQTPLPTTVLQRTPTKEFPLKNMDLPIASSSFYILTLLDQCSTLVVFKQDSELYQIDLSSTLIFVHDLCWSTKLNMFLMGGYGLYTFNPASRQLTIIEQIELTPGEWIVSIACQSHSVYLLYSSRSTRIECRSLSMPYVLERQWLQKSFLRSKDFLAQCIRINDWNILAMTIKQKNGEWRVDLFDSINLRRLYRTCSLGQGIPGMRNCLLLPYERSWMVINNCSIPKQVILLDENGKVKAKTQMEKLHSFFNLCLLGKEWIAMNFKDQLRLYKI